VETRSTAADTDYAIRFALMQPRRKLLYSASDYEDKLERGSPGKGVRKYVPTPLSNQKLQENVLDANQHIILESPFPLTRKEALINPDAFRRLNLPLCDANNGPMPLECNVWRVDGFKTFRVDYAIQTDLVERYDIKQDSDGNIFLPNPILSHL